MKVALVNPPWSFEGSIYFGCREPHLPLELGYAKALLEGAGHQVLLLDGHLNAQDIPSLVAEVAAFAPGMTVVTTAPSYLFWRCAPPELRVPGAFLQALDGSCRTPIAALATVGGGELTFLGEVLTPDGKHCWRRKVTVALGADPAAAARALGLELGAQIRAEAGPLYQAHFKDKGW